MALLEIREVGKSFGSLQALAGVDVTIAGGSFHGLIGPNGSGKSTLLKAIAGDHFADAGRIVFDGVDITTMHPAERARLGLSLKFQITAVLPEISPYDNLLLAAQADQTVWQLLRSRSKAELDDEILTCLARFNLADRADSLAAELSHGEQQWLEIAMSLMRKPKLLLLDEPTGGMSPEERRATGRLLEPIKSECSLVIVEHDLEFIKDICDHLTVLDNGRVLDDGTIEYIEKSAKVKEVYTTRV
tara:strand:+ start:1015 stop:1749 length:735 start_codon:yes stop_codon:yes gene_type:complete